MCSTDKDLPEKEGGRSYEGSRGGPTGGKEHKWAGKVHCKRSGIFSVKKRKSLELSELRISTLLRKRNCPVSSKGRGEEEEGGVVDWRQTGNYSIGRGSMQQR